MASLPPSNNVSRNSSVGSKRSLNQDSSAQPPRKRRNRPNRTEKRAGARASASTGSGPATSAEQSHPQVQNSSTDHSDAVAQTKQPLDVAGNGLGRNRLATGFPRPPATTGELSSTDEPTLTIGESVDSAIEISDDEDNDDEEMEDSEGGMVINLQEQQPNAIVIVDDDDDNGGGSESGEYSPVPLESAATQDSTQNSNQKVAVDTRPSGPQLRLVDLDRDELEDQIKYAFYQFERDQIDPNRLVLCLQCQSEGHLSKNCEEKPQSFFAMPKIKQDVQVKLWISCCVCASKSHLVGDCPRADRSRATRWSLSSLDPSQIVNMSLETGTRRLEVEAESRGMRPTGLQIRGRAAQHFPGHHIQFEVESSDEEFLPNVRARQQQQQQRGEPSSRYDRFDAPSGPSQNRGRGEWYATDSFGRRRSHSPGADQRPPVRSRRSPSPRRGNDSWQPPRGRAQASNARYSSPPKSRSRAPTSARPPSKPSIQITLPTRKGSNTWSQNGQSTDSAPGTGTSGPSHGSNAASGPKAKSGRKRRGKKRDV